MCTLNFNESFKVTIYSLKHTRNTQYYISKIKVSKQDVQQNRRSDNRNSMLGYMALFIIR